MSQGFVTCSSSERSEFRVSKVVPRDASSRMRAKRAGSVLKKKLLFCFSPWRIFFPFDIFCGITNFL